jgi:hypothetical protein
MKNNKLKAYIMPLVTNNTVHTTIYFSLYSNIITIIYDDFLS